MGRGNHPECPACGLRHAADRGCPDAVEVERGQRRLVRPKLTKKNSKARKAKARGPSRGTIPARKKVLPGRKNLGSLKGAKNVQRRVREWHDRDKVIEAVARHLRDAAGVTRLTAYGFHIMAAAAWTRWVYDRVVREAGRPDGLSLADVIDQESSLLLDALRRWGLAEE